MNFKIQFKNLPPIPPSVSVAKTKKSEMENLIEKGIRFEVPMAGLNLEYIYFNNQLVASVEFEKNIYKREAYKALNNYEKSLVNKAIKSCLK